MSKFEIELRGELAPQQYSDLGRFLAHEGKLVRKYERTMWCFGLSSEKKIDLRIKETNKELEFSLKVGKLSDTNRKEISIPIPRDKSKQAFEFLKFLGHREGIKAVRNATIYEYKGIEWAVVEVTGHSFYFEAEKLVENKREGSTAEAEIREIAAELHLDIFSPEETMDYIKLLDKEANKVFKL